MDNFLIDSCQLFTFCESSFSFSFNFSWLFVHFLKHFFRFWSSNKSQITFAVIKSTLCHLWLLTLGLNDYLQFVHITTVKLENLRCDFLRHSWLTEEEMEKKKNEREHVVGLWVRKVSELCLMSVLNFRTPLQDVGKFLYFFRAECKEKKKTLSVET